MKRIFCFIFGYSIAFVANAQIVKAERDVSKVYPFGFKDAKGNWVVKPQYKLAVWNDDWKLGTFEMEYGGPRGLLDAYGKIIFPLGKYKKYYYDGNFIHITDLYNKVGLAKTDGSIIVPCEWKEIYAYDDKDYIEVIGFNDKVGLTRMDGSIILPCEWKKIFVNSNEKYIDITDSNDKMGLARMDGTIILSCEWKKIFVNSNEKYINVTDSNEKVGLVSMDGSIILPCIWKEIYPFDDRIHVVDTNGKHGLFSTEGKELIPCIYEDISFFDSHLSNYMSVKSTNGYGIISIKGEEVVPCIYPHYVKKAAEDIFLVYNGKWGYYAKGREIIPCQYDDATEFLNDVATVKKDGEVKLIKNPLKDGSQIQISEVTSPSNKKKNGPAVSRYPAPDSDVDKNIPTAAKTADNTFAFIIANENYPDAPVPYSLNDGRMFKEYCQKALGLPEKNINLYEDATFGGIITAVEKMKSIAEAYDGEASVIFYYAGHGFPDEKQNTAYLLPIDGDASNIITTGYSLAKLYKELSGLKLKSSIVFLDACFSGAKREDQMLSQSRGVAIKVKDEAPQGNMLVFSAAQGDETAHQMEEKHHGLFTYYLLKELQATGGDVDMGTLTEYVTKQVKRQSVVINNKKQTPTVIPSQALVDSWRTLKIGN